ncbi:MAG: hypothetical protein KGN84_03885 [Acidobacteriota bacterium]|nr:hypothetical protein [Acidobacteriota bacterium]
MTRRNLLATAPALLLPGCSPAPKPAPKPVEPVTGLHALYAMYQHARTWAQDLMVVRLTSIDITQVPDQPGKVGAWQAVLASPSHSQQRASTFSVFDASPSLRSGIFADAPGPLASDVRPFPLAALRTDSDQAYETALRHAAEYSRKNPHMQITYQLEMERRVNDPLWRVIWGSSITSSVFSILIDASTGEYMQTLS